MKLFKFNHIELTLVWNIMRDVEINKFDISEDEDNP